MNTTGLLHRLIGKLPGAEALEKRDASRLEQTLPGWPPGHYYSPLPDLDQLRLDEARVFAPPASSLRGIDLDVAGQLELLETIAPHANELRFQDARCPEFRYYYENDYFSYGEAVILFCLLRHLRPRRIIEVGSGFSSALMLDTVTHSPTIDCSLTFIEPYPDRLQSLLHPGDGERITLVESRVQDADLAGFEALDAGDVLFIDSSHVSKVHSDVNHLLFEVLPRLKAGVLVHFHDIAYPFEYPKAWIYEGRAWTEAYLLRAFLQYNAAFRIRFFNSYLGQFHADRVGAMLPLFMRNPGTSLWLEKIRL